jgi:hypothetical protein
MQTELKPLSNAPDYALAESGYVYNVKTKRRIKRQWVSGRWRSHIRDSAGKPFYLCHDSCNINAASDTLAREQIRLLPDNQKYGVTPYGAIWCLKPACKGPNAGEPFILKEHFRGNHRYVKIANKFGQQRAINVKRLMEQTWGTVQSE